MDTHEKGVLQDASSNTNQIHCNRKAKRPGKLETMFNRFAQGDDIRRGAEEFESPEMTAGAGKAKLDLVGNEQSTGSMDFVDNSWKITIGYI